MANGLNIKTIGNGMPLELRDYQSRAIAECRREFSRGVKRLLLVMPTGSGKTLTSSFITRSHVDRHCENRTLFVAYGRELIRQASDTYEDYGIPNGIIMAGRDYIPEYPVQVASIDTLMSWVVRRQKIRLPKFTMVIWDEAHRILSAKFQKVMALYPDAWHIGLTATPIRGDGRSLGGAFESMVNAVTYEQLLRDGHIVPVRVFAPSEPDLKGIKISQGDYDQRQLQERMDKVELVGDIVSHWRKHAADRQTFAFLSGVDHSIHVCKEFQANGINAAHIQGGMDTAERDQILADFKAGRIQVICNYGCLIEGVDCPECSALILAQPTRQLGRFRQIAGRILRPYPGKTDALILDHAGAVHRHGWPTDDVEWSMDPDVNVQQRHEAKRKRDTSKVSNEPITCKMCHAVRKGGAECPACGFKPTRQGKGADIADGVLTEVSQAKVKKASKDDKRSAWDKFVGICIHQNKPIKCAAGMYHAKFGVYPRGFSNMPRGHEQWQMKAKDWYQVHVSQQEVSV